MSGESKMHYRDDDKIVARSEGQELPPSYSSEEGSVLRPYSCDRYYEVTLHDSFDIVGRVNHVIDPGLIPKTLGEDAEPPFRDSHVELNIGSIGAAREIHEALGDALEQYDEQYGGEQ